VTYLHHSGNVSVHQLNLILGSEVLTNRSWTLFIVNVVYYERINREKYKRLIYECQCDERLKVKVERSVVRLCI
jgi:hypothetical protein